MRHRRGFTLIELAIVLVLIGLLVGMGAGLIGLLVKRVHYNQTRERLDANVEALIGGFRGCIPATDNASTAFGYCNLSVLRNRTDAWREDFLCLVADEIANYNSYCDACARRTTSLKVVDEMDNNATHENIAFVLISKGPDHRLQTDIGNDTVEIHVPGRAYDDLVRYVTLNELKAKLKCEYAEERLRILNNELPYGFVGSSYNATVYAEGGVPFPSDGKYRWCVEDPNNVDNKGLDFFCNGTVAPSPNCSSEPEENWPQCDNFTLNGTPTSSRVYYITFWVRDNNDPSGPDDNIASKTLVLTIHPQQGQQQAITCNYGDTITVTNVGNTRYYEKGTILGIICWLTSSCFSFNSVVLNQGDCLAVYTDANCRRRNLESTFTYDDAYNADTSHDCNATYNNGVLGD